MNRKNKLIVQPITTVARNRERNATEKNIHREESFIFGFSGEKPKESSAPPFRPPKYCNAQ